jgi:hypothetical protein
MPPGREHLENAFDMLEAFAHGQWAGMRAFVSELSEGEFATVVAELVDDGYFEGIGVFRPLGRPSPVIVRSDGTRSANEGNGSLGSGPKTVPWKAWRLPSQPECPVPVLCVKRPKTCGRSSGLSRGCG